MFLNQKVRFSLLSQVHGAFYFGFLRLQSPRKRSLDYFANDSYSALAIVAFSNATPLLFSSPSFWRPQLLPCLSTSNAIIASSSTSGAGQPCWRAYALAISVRSTTPLPESREREGNREIGGEMTRTTAIISGHSREGQFRQALNVDMKRSVRAMSEHNRTSGECRDTKTNRRYQFRRRKNWKPTRANALW